MVTSLSDSPLEYSKQHHWHHLAGQLHVWQNYFHSNWIFIIGQTQGWGYKVAVGGKVWRRSQALTAEWVWNAKARLLPCSPAPRGGAKKPGLLSPTEWALKTIWHDFFQKPLLAFAASLDALVAVSDYQSIKPAALSSETSCEITRAGEWLNEWWTVFSHFEGDFFFFFMRRGFNTSSFLGGDGTVQADWNLMLLLTSASPAVIVPLLKITAAVEEQGWVAQTPCLISTAPSWLLCSDTTAPALPQSLTRRWFPGWYIQNSFIHTLSQK